MASGVVNQSAVINASSSGDNTVVSAVPDHRIVVTTYAVVNNVATAQAVTFKSGSSTSLSGAMQLPQAIGGGLVAASGASDVSLFQTAPGEALVANLSAATAVAGHVSYRLVRGV